jgi:hypothetical protein
MDSIPVRNIFFTSVPFGIGFPPMLSRAKTTTLSGEMSLATDPGDTES